MTEYVRAKTLSDVLRLDIQLDPKLVSALVQKMYKSLNAVDSVTVFVRRDVLAASVFGARRREIWREIWCGMDSHWAIVNGMTEGDVNKVSQIKYDEG